MVDETRLVLGVAAQAAGALRPSYANCNEQQICDLAGVGYSIPTCD